MSGIFPALGSDYSIHDLKRVGMEDLLLPNVRDYTSNATSRIISPISAPPKRCTEKLTRLEEVFRETEVLGVGDLHGNAEILYKNLESLGVIDGDKNWIGGDRRLVFLGDIIGDRGTTGLECMRFIDMLRLQARMCGGDISVLAGNHENIAIGCLTNTRIALGTGDILERNLKSGFENAFEHAFFKCQGLGIIEFARDYLGRDVTPNLAGMNSIREIYSTILHVMRNSPEGVIMLQNLCQLKLVEHIDDTLFLHTIPTPEIAQNIQKHGVDYINDLYQIGLEGLLFEDNAIVSPDFQEIVDTFLYVGNRTNYLGENETIELQKLGFNRIIHGHVNTKGKKIYVGELEIQSIDHSAGRGGEHMEARSICRIKTDGQMVNGEE